MSEPLDLDAIEAKAQAALAEAPDDEWTDDGYRIWTHPDQEQRVVLFEYKHVTIEPRYKGYEFIAAANPKAVLELIAEVKRLRAELAFHHEEDGDGLGEVKVLKRGYGPNAGWVDGWPDRPKTS